MVPKHFRVTRNYFLVLALVIIPLMWVSHLRDWCRVWPPGHAGDSSPLLVISHNDRWWWWISAKTGLQQSMLVDVDGHVTPRGMTVHMSYILYPTMEDGTDDEETNTCFGVDVTGKQRADWLPDFIILFQPGKIALGAFLMIGCAGNRKSVLLSLWCNPLPHI